MGSEMCIRDRTHPDAPYAIRVKAPREGKTVIHDAVQGDVTFGNDQLDDMIVLRSDGNPTYMLAVVVDDHDMGVTHVIRGDDHLNNAARQKLVYDAMGWDVPVFAHIPLIHGPDGKKLSKRHGAAGVEEYRALGYPASAMRNYLARLGWSHGDDEVFTDAQAIEWFDISGIGKGAARLDFKKLDHVSGQHIQMTDPETLISQLQDYLDATSQPALTETQVKALLPALEFTRTGAKTLPQLLEKSHFALASRPLDRDEKAEAALDDVSRSILMELTPQLQTASWMRDDLEAILNATAEAHGVKFGKLAAPLRAALAGRAQSPSVFDMMLTLGRDETIARLQDASK